MTALEIRSEARNVKYLGLTVYMGKSKAQTFAYLKDRAQNNLGVEREVTVQGREGCFDKSGCLGDPSICHVLF